MNTEDNVVKMPDVLTRYESARAKQQQGLMEMRAAERDYGEAMLEARAEFKSKEEFEQWVIARGLDRPYRRAAMRAAQRRNKGVTS